MTDTNKALEALLSEILQQLKVCKEEIYRPVLMTQGQFTELIKIVQTAQQTQANAVAMPEGAFKIGDRVRKKGNKGQWHGRICGFYRATHTPIGYAVESERELGSVQIYPETALEIYEREQK